MMFWYQICQAGTARAQMIVLDIAMHVSSEHREVDIKCLNAPAHMLAQC